MPDADVTYQHLTGRWAHIVDDGIVDTDPYPDETAPVGSVSFTPHLGANGFLPAGDPTRSVTVSPVPALIAGGLLTDLQGREGIWLVATIGGYGIYWTATPRLSYNDQLLATKPITFAPPADGSTEVHLNDLIDVTAPDGTIIRHPTPTRVLNLPTVGDFTYTYRLRSGTFAEGAALYYLLGTPPQPAVRWDFTVADTQATLRIDASEHADISSGSYFWLLHRPSADGPAYELLTGRVRKENA